MARAAPAILNAANEVAVAAFLAGRIGFLDIAAIVASALDRCSFEPPATIEDILAIDAAARAEAARKAEGLMV